MAISYEAKRGVAKWRFLPLRSDYEAGAEKNVRYFEMGSPFDATVEGTKHVAKADALR